MTLPVFHLTTRVAPVSGARLRAQFRLAFRDFVCAYKEAYTQLSRGHFKDVFPEGSIPPTAWAT